MKDSLKQDLKALVCEGNVAKLPTTPLNSYPELKKALVNACGKYKKNAFTFPTPAQDVINTLVGGTVVNFKKDFQFFATPPELADRMMQDVVFDKPTMTVLEPSAGHGALIEALIKISPTGVRLDIQALELSALNFSVLKDKSEGSNVKVWHGNFMEYDTDKEFDLIIANPPFTKNQDIDHIRKMYDLLALGGRIITIASLSWLNGSQKKQIAFRDWLDGLGAVWQELDKGVFKSSGTNVSGVYLVIDK